MHTHINGLTRIILVRHGQTLANEKQLLQGSSDGPLNAQGRQEVERLGLHLGNFQIDHVISSDLIRALDTAQA
ncbi:MAG: histidine phosphatase family protein, partial [Bacteroides sp.]|nr:histidine phosphatase family protein [Bacteroides sp.]